MTEEHNIYGSPPGTGITIPPYYMPSPSVRNKTNYFPQSEQLSPDEMRFIFIGSQLRTRIVAIGSPGCINSTNLRQRFDGCVILAR